MEKIKKNLVEFFVCFVLSFIVAWVAKIEQPVVFFCLEIASWAFEALRYSYMQRYNVILTLGAVLAVLCAGAVAMIPTALVAWIFSLNFFVVFEVAAFISIFLFNGKKKNKPIEG